MKHQHPEDADRQVAAPPSPVPDVYDTLAAHTEVVAQLAQSQDGFIAAHTGDAEFVSGELDRRHLHCLRAVVDAVLVGAATVAADDPQLTVRAVEGDNPIRVILDPRARIPAASRVLQCSDAPTLWLVAADAQVPNGLATHVRVVRLPTNQTSPVDPWTVLAVLRERVTGSILIERGGRTVSDFLTAGVLDRLFLTTAPVLIGDGVPGIRFNGAPTMSGALRHPFRRYIFGQDVCIEYLLSPAAQAHSDHWLSPAKPEPGT